MATPEAPAPGRDAPEHGRSTMSVVAALVALAVGVFAGWRAWELGIGSLNDPGPGLWPLVISVVMVVCAVTLFLTADRAEEDPFTAASGVVLLGVASLVAYAWAFELVGFEIPTALLLLLWLKVIGGESWRTTLAVTVGATAAFYLIFVVALGVSLPRLIAL